MHRASCFPSYAEVLQKKRVALPYASVSCVSWGIHLFTCYYPTFYLIVDCLIPVHYCCWSTPGALCLHVATACLWRLRKLCAFKACCCCFVVIRYVARSYRMTSALQLTAAAAWSWSPCPLPFLLDILWYMVHLLTLLLWHSFLFFFSFYPFFSLFLSLSVCTNDNGGRRTSRRMARNKQGRARQKKERETKNKGHAVFYAFLYFHSPFVSPSFFVHNARALCVGALLGLLS